MAVAKEQIRQIISENNFTSVADVHSLLRESLKDILQELMEAELDASLGYEKNQKGDLVTDNKRNGHFPKTLKSRYGEFQVEVPRDRNGEFGPKLIPKHQRGISGIEEKVISLYARGMSTRDIHDQIQDLYGIELSAEMVSKTFKYVNYSGLKKSSSDFKAVYNAPTETAAFSELEGIKEKWGRKFPYAVSNWENN